MRRNLFFDVDGTLLPFGRGLPQDTLDALLEARSKGHRLFLATGRSPAELDDRLSAIPFDGGVYSGGARAFLEGKDVYASYFTREDLDFYLEVCQSHGWQVLLQTDGHSFCLSGFADLMVSWFRRYAGGDIKIANVELVDSLDGIDKVTKLLLLAPKGDMDEAHRLLDARFDVIVNTVGVPARLMSEVCQKGVDKASAMLALLEAEGEDVTSSIAFGDGSNDIPIIRAAGIGVAMGNADDEVKAAADFVTADCGDGGIRLALEHFGVL